MLSDKVLEKTALYFYYVFLEETKAQVATGHAIKYLKKKYGEQNIPENETDIAIIEATTFVLKKSLAIKSANYNLATSHLQLPSNSNWGPWFEFKKTASHRDISILVFVKMLGFKVADIAKVLCITEGTVRYRLGHALNSIGERLNKEGVAHV